MYNYEMIRNMNLDILYMFLNEIKNTDRNFDIHNWLMRQATEENLKHYKITTNIMDKISELKSENISLKRTIGLLGNKGNTNRGKRKRKNANNL
jgi:hypothetical protein